MVHLNVKELFLFVLIVFIQCKNISSDELTTTICPEEMKKQQEAQLINKHLIKKRQSDSYSVYSTIQKGYGASNSTDESRPYQQDQNQVNTNHGYSTLRLNSNSNDIPRKSYQTVQNNNQRPPSQYSGYIRRQFSNNYAPPQVQNRYYQPTYQKQRNPYPKTYQGSFKTPPARTQGQSPNVYVNFPSNGGPQPLYRANQSVRRQFQNTRPVQATTVRPASIKPVYRKKFRPLPVFA